jgi:hypothetical protein
MRSWSGYTFSVSESLGFASDDTQAFDGTQTAMSMKTPIFIDSDNELDTPPKVAGSSKPPKSVCVSEPPKNASALEMQLLSQKETDVANYANTLRISVCK